MLGDACVPFTCGTLTLCIAKCVALCVCSDSGCFQGHISDSRPVKLGSAGESRDKSRIPNWKTADFGVRTLG